jgi:hypothetical protein
MAPHHFPVEIAFAGLVVGSAMIVMLAVLTVAAMAGNGHHTCAVNAVQMLVMEIGVAVAATMRSAATVAVMMHVIVVAAASPLCMAGVVAVAAAAAVYKSVTVEMGGQVAAAMRTAATVMVHVSVVAAASPLCVMGLVYVAAPVHMAVTVDMKVVVTIRMIVDVVVVVAGQKYNASPHLGHSDISPVFLHEDTWHQM